MAASIRKVGLAIVLLLALQFDDAYTESVWLSDRDGYTIYRAPIAPTCTDIPPWAINRQLLNGSYASKMRTDACVVVYRNPGCQLYYNKDFESFKIDRNMSLVNMTNPVYSFISCNDTEGGNTINLDFYTPEFHSRDTSKPLETYLEFQLQDLCGCSTFRRIADYRAINNHGNCIDLYEGEDCSGDKQRIHGGWNEATYDVGPDFTSVAPCQMPLHCLKLSAKIVKFEINETKSKLLHSQSQTLDVSLSTKGTFINNGQANIIHEYVAKKSIQQSTKISKVTSFSTMHSVQIAANVNFKYDVGIPWFDHLTVTGGLSAAYQFNYNSSSQTSETYSTNQSRKFQVTQKIEIPPCTAFEIESFVKFTENYPVQYSVYAEISAMHGEERVLAEDISKSLTDMVYVNTVDEYTILAKGKSHATSDFGIETHVTGSSLKVNGCASNFYQFP